MIVDAIEAADELCGLMGISLVKLCRWVFGFENLHKNLNTFSKQTREICFIKPRRDYVCYLK